jgi:hypothetical protein
MCHQNVQALDSVRHPTGRDTCQFGNVTEVASIRQVSLVGPKITSGEIGVGRERRSQFRHQTVGL